MPNYSVAMKYCRESLFIFQIIIYTSLLTIGCTTLKEYRTIDGFTQGTTFHIAYSADIPDSLDSVVGTTLKRVDNSLSVYNDSSIISRLNRGENVRMDSIFINVFNKSREMYNISEGAFDISGAPFFDAWGFGFKNRVHVTQKIIDSIKVFVGMDKVRIENGVLIKSDPRLSLNANAIAQGYTPDLIASEFDRLGIKNYMIEVGGEIFCKGVNPEGKEWTVGIDKPVEGNMDPGENLQTIISISGRGLATSGNYRKFYEEGGEKYSHTIDPRTGYPVRHNLLSATVIAGDAMTADAYATYFMVIGLEKTEKFLENNKQIDAYLVYSQGNEFKVFKTNGVKIK